MKHEEKLKKLENFELESLYFLVDICTLVIVCNKPEKLHLR
jgi:hypothetical protein